LKYLSANGERIQSILNRKLLNLKDKTSRMVINVKMTLNKMFKERCLKVSLKVISSRGAYINEQSGSKLE
jgi:hypothetical protein